MHRKLRELAQRQDRSVVAPEPAPSRIASGVAPRSRAFADQVKRSLDGPVLRYSQRRSLLRSARQIGMGEFEANLVIAAVLHGHRSSQTQDVPALPPPHHLGKRLALAPFLVVLAVESFVAMGIWRVCFAG